MNLFESVSSGAATFPVFHEGAVQMVQPRVVNAVFFLPSGFFLLPADGVTRRSIIDTYLKTGLAKS